MAEYDAVSSLYPHCILTVSLQREVEGGGLQRRWWKVEGYGQWWAMAVEDGAVSSLYPHCIPLYPHCILTVSPLYPHCILTVALQREVSAESCGGEGGGWWWRRWWRVVVVEGGGGGGWWRRRAAEYDIVSSLYPHCFLTVSPCILTVSSLYPHCIITVSSLCPSKERCLRRKRRRWRRRKDEGEEYRGGGGHKTRNKKM